MELNAVMEDHIKKMKLEAKMKEAREGAWEKSLARIYEREK